MVIPRALFSSFLLAILVLLVPGEVHGDRLNRLESVVHDDPLPFTQGLGFQSTVNLATSGMQNGVDDVVQAWYLDSDSKEDIRLPHRRRPEDRVPLRRLLDLGIGALRHDAENQHDENFTISHDQRDNVHMDILDLTPDQPMLKLFFAEHLHTHEEIRFCLKGSGYFDIRDEDDRWIRVSVKKGALIVVPAGIYHRFTLDTDNYFKVIRVFSGGHWKPYYRPHDHLPARKIYLAKLHKGREA